MKNIIEDERLNKLNHSCAHLLAQAVKQMYPQAMFWVGPVVETGFYYDIDLGDTVITEEDLAKIEKETGCKVNLVLDSGDKWIFDFEENQPEIDKDADETDEILGLNFDPMYVLMSKSNGEFKYFAYGEHNELVSKGRKIDLKSTLGS